MSKQIIRPGKSLEIGKAGGKLPQPVTKSRAKLSIEATAKLDHAFDKNRNALIKVLKLLISDDGSVKNKLG